MAAALFSLGDWAAPPPSCERACNEMEMLSGLPGTRPALCSTDSVATLMGVWPYLEHGSNSSSATIYQLAPAINLAYSTKCQSAQQLNRQTCV